MNPSIAYSPKRAFQTSLFLVLVAICAALHIWKLPPALLGLQHELGLNLVESGFLLSSVQIGGMLLGLVIGLFSERIGLRRCMLIGLAILTLSSAGSTLFQTKTVILLFRAIEGCGFLMVVLPGPALIKRIVPPDTISRIMGFWGCYMPTAAVIILLFGSWLLSLSSWRALWLLLAAVTFVVFCFALFIIPSDKLTSGSKTVSPAIMGMVRTTLSSKRVWMIAIIFGAYAAQWAAIVGFLPTIYMVGNVSGPTAGVLTACVAGSNVIGNLGAGRLLHRGFSAQKLLTIGFFTMILCSVIAFGLTKSMVVQFIAILLFSAVGGLIPATLFFLAVTFAPTPQTTSSTVGWVQQCSSFGQFVGPPVVAWVVNLLGGWQWSWLGTVGFALLGLLMVWQLNIKKQRD